MIQARNQAVSGLEQAAANPGDPAAMQALASAEQGLSGALGRLFALAEAYPDLKANQNMAQLTEEITSTENKVAFARQAYNDSVMEYNTYRQTFPPVLFASILGHGQDAELLDFDDAQIAEAPKVSFYVNESRARESRVKSQELATRSVAGSRILALDS